MTNADALSKVSALVSSRACVCCWSHERVHSVCRRPPRCCSSRLAVAWRLSAQRLRPPAKDRIDSPARRLDDSEFELKARVLDLVIDGRRMMRLTHVFSCMFGVQAVASVAHGLFQSDQLPHGCGCMRGSESCRGRGIGTRSCVLVSSSEVSDPIAGPSLPRRRRRPSPA